MSEKQSSTVGNYPTTGEAHAARLLLASQGIAAVVVDEALVGNFWYLGNAVGGIKLQVDAVDEARARQVLDESAVPSDGDSANSPEASWICLQCRQRVPTNFDVCWSCGAQRGPADLDVSEQPNPPQQSQPPQVDLPAATKPDLIAREPICAACGASLPSPGGRCMECGHPAALNPYEAPLHATPGAVERPRGVLREQRLAADALAQRAWLAAIFGLVFCPPLLSIYSVLLLVILAERHERLSPRMFRRVVWAWAANAVVLLITGAILFLVFG